MGLGILHQAGLTPRTGTCGSATGSPAGWSQSLLVPSPTRRLLRLGSGYVPSFIYVDELTLQRKNAHLPCSPVKPSIKHRGATTIHQAAPRGPSNWVYSIFEDVLDEETGESDKDFGVYMSQSPSTHRLLRHLKSLEQILKQPVERRRLILGEWIDKPSGEALFRVL